AARTWTHRGAAARLETANRRWGGGRGRARAEQEDWPGAALDEPSRDEQAQTAEAAADQPAAIAIERQTLGPRSRRVGNEARHEAAAAPNRDLWFAAVIKDRCGGRGCRVGARFEIDHPCTQLRMLERDHLGDPPDRRLDDAVR